MCLAGFVQLLIVNVLVRTPVCKPIASPGSQEKMCRAGFLQLLIANILDRTPVCKVRAMLFPLKSREDSQRRICASLQRKWLFWMTHVQPCANNLVRFASVILARLPFVKLERLTFVDLVTLPFVNPCNAALCQNMQLKITSTILFLQLKFSN